MLVVDFGSIGSFKDSIECEPRFAEHEHESKHTLIPSEVNDLGYRASDRLKARNRNTGAR